MAAGSVYAIQGAGLSDDVFTAPSFPLPRSLGGVSVAGERRRCPSDFRFPAQILLQVPWNTGTETDRGGEDGIVLDLRAAAAPGKPRFCIASTFVKLPRSPSAYGGFDALAVHQNWDGLVTSDNPARPNEILHLYGTGFGRVDFQPPDGMPAPADPPSRTVMPVTCWAWGADNFTKSEIPVCSRASLRGWPAITSWTCNCLRRTCALPFSSTAPGKGTAAVSSARSR